MRRITNLNAFRSVEMPNSQKSVTEFPGKDSFKLLKVSVVCLEMSSDSKIIFAFLRKIFPSLSIP